METTNNGIKWKMKWKPPIMDYDNLEQLFRCWAPLLAFLAMRPWDPGRIKATFVECDSRCSSNNHDIAGVRI